MIANIISRVYATNIDTQTRKSKHGRYMHNTGENCQCCGLRRRATGFQQPRKRTVSNNTKPLQQTHCRNPQQPPAARTSVGRSTNSKICQNQRCRQPLPYAGSRQMQTMANRFNADIHQRLRQDAPSARIAMPLSDSRARDSGSAGQGNIRHWLIKVHQFDHAQIIESTNQREQYANHRQPDLADIHYRLNHRRFRQEAELSPEYPPSTPSNGMTKAFHGPRFDSGP